MHHDHNHHYYPCHRIIGLFVQEWPKRHKTCNSNMQKSETLQHDRRHKTQVRLRTTRKITLKTFEKRIHI